LKLVQETAGNTLEAIDTGKDFPNRTLAAQQLRENMDKWDYMKFKSFCTTKEMVSKLKRPLTEWEKIFSGYYIYSHVYTLFGAPLPAPPHPAPCFQVEPVLPSCSQFC
jgi:hypothetical protein